MVYLDCYVCPECIGVESLLIPLEHGDIVLEKGTYDRLDQEQDSTPTNAADMNQPTGSESTGNVKKLCLHCGHQTV